MTATERNMVVEEEEEDDDEADCQKLMSGVIQYDCQVAYISYSARLPYKIEEQPVQVEITAASWGVGGGGGTKLGAAVLQTLHPLVLYPQ